MESIIDQLREERRQLQKDGQLPDWFTTAAWQTVKKRYLTANEKGMRDVWERVSRTAAKHLPGEMQDLAYNKFFNLFWKGWLAGATPVLSNMGTDRGCPVSCSGGYVADQIGGESGFYGALKEGAVLTKNGFGISNYLGHVRKRGAGIATGGHASGILPVFKGFVQMSADISQGNTRRGAWVGYVDVDHGDFWEVLNYVMQFPDDANIGWCISDDFIFNRLNKGDKEALEKYQAIMHLKVLTGKGYFFKTDAVNRANPECYEKLGLEVRASNLCTEITLPATVDYTFTCVLSSMNAAKYPEWKDTDAPYWATIFLDCVASEFIAYCRRDAELEIDLRKAVAFTENSRALGLGCLGFHTLLQQEGIAFEELKAQFINNDIFRTIKYGAVEASKYLAKTLGEPEWMKGTGLRNSHLLAVAPNTSSAMICGGVSQGIEPVVANVWNQNSAAGEIARISPIFLQLMKEKGMYSKETLRSIIKKSGSVQHLDWLSDQEKLVFKTAYEINQSVLVRLAGQRQKHICQGQSLNLFFAADESEEVISRVHKEALLNNDIKTLYYLRTMAGVQGSSGECIACEG